MHFVCLLGAFVVKVPKETEGEHFDGLDMLTKLLAPAGKTTAKQPLIEVLGKISGPFSVAA